jgi:CheY-like chemotaxis protein
VELAFDGPSALAASRRLRPDVVLLDIGLPGMNGYEVVKALRRESELAETLFVAVSGYNQRGHPLSPEAAAFDWHLTKPINILELNRVLKTLVGV